MHGLQQPSVRGDVILEVLLLLLLLLLLRLLLLRLLLLLVLLVWGYAGVHVVQVRLRFVHESVLSSGEIVRCHAQDGGVLEGEGLCHEERSIR